MDTSCALRQLVGANAHKARERRVGARVIACAGVCRREVGDVMMMRISPRVLFARRVRGV